MNKHFVSASREIILFPLPKEIIASICFYKRNQVESPKTTMKTKKRIWNKGLDLWPLVCFAASKLCSLISICWFCRVYSNFLIRFLFHFYHFFCFCFCWLENSWERRCINGRWIASGMLDWRDKSKSLCVLASGGKGYGFSWRYRSVINTFSVNK